MVNSWNQLKVLIKEGLFPGGLERRPEPDLVMDAKENARHFSLHGHLKSPLGMSYLFYAAHICEVIRKGDLVLDLGCGPGNLLALVAELNPQARFVGVDLSESMLEIAQERIRKAGLSNVELLRADMSDLKDFRDASVDAAYSTVSLHHLPSEEALNSLFREVNRVLKPDGGLFLTDYGRLKFVESIVFFANLYRDYQSPILTEDFQNSLFAAFSMKEVRRAWRKNLSHRSGLFVTPWIPMAFGIKSTARRDGGDQDYKNHLKSRVAELDPYLSRELGRYIRLFRRGGLRDSCF